MTHLSELFDPGLLTEMVESKMVRRFEHNNGDLLGYDYTQRAQWEREWNPVTLQCRGLITDTDGHIVARPFPKFFNLGEQPEEDAKRQGQPFTLTEKVDGSLGIHYTWKGREAIATRGSFHSPQAEWASENLHDHVPPGEAPDDVTFLFEIVYPENRVVVDYGGREALVFLSAIDIPTGRPANVYWVPSKRAKGYQPGDNIHNVKSLWSHLDTGNHEGFVATYPDGYRVKIKLDEYVRLHRIMSSTSNRTIWEALSAGTDLDQIMESVPDEFMEWVEDVSTALEGDYNSLKAAARVEFDRIASEVGTQDRKAFALIAKESPNAGLLFAMLDDKDLAPLLWRRLRPETLEYPPVGGGGEHADVAA